MASEGQTLRDWYRLFGLLLTDLFSDSPFVVEVERDLSVQQQLLDVVMVRRGRGRFSGRLPDGLEGLRPHNLITFKSHRETLDGWAMKELVGHYVAYHKLVSRSPSELLAEDQFGLYAVTARSPRNLAGQVRWQRVQAGVYGCEWGTHTIRVVVAGELSREPHNAPLHLFSASPDLVGFGGRAYQPHQPNASGLLVELIEGLEAEGLPMAYTMEDFQRDFVKKHFPRLTREDQEDVLQTLPPEARLAGLPPEARLAGLSEAQVRQLLEKLSADRAPQPRPKRRPVGRSRGAPKGKAPKKRG